MVQAAPSNQLTAAEQAMNKANAALERCTAFLERRNVAGAQAKVSNLAASSQNVINQMNVVEEIHARIDQKMRAKCDEADQHFRR